MARILVIDDEKGIHSLLNMALSRHGHEIFSAFNGEEGIVAFQKEIPTLVIVDIFMPVMDGIETIKGIRKIDSAVKILAISGAFSPGLLDSARNEGAQHTLSKPFTLREIASMVNLCLEEHEEGCVLQKLA